MRVLNLLADVHLSLQVRVVQLGLVCSIQRFDCCVGGEVELLLWVIRRQVLALHWVVICLILRHLRHIHFLLLNWRVQI